MRRIGLAILGLVVAVFGQPKPVRVAEYPSALVREEQSIIVDGVSEIWRLQCNALVQRWLANFDEDFKLTDREDFPTLVSKRPMVQVMHFADYDHDGKATEDWVSKNNPRLHVFGTASDPNKPLYLQKREWELLLKASAPLEVLDWNCGDHGSEAETRLRVYWTPKGIDGVRHYYSCAPNPRRLI